MPKWFWLLDKMQKIGQTIKLVKDPLVSLLFDALLFFFVIVFFLIFCIEEAARTR